MRKLADAPARAARRAGRHAERHADRAVPHPGIQPLVEAHALAHTVHGVDGLAVEQAKVARSFRQHGAAQPPEGGVEEPREETVRQAVGVPVDAPAIDHVGALAPVPDEVGDQLGRMLEVGVHEHGGVAGRVGEPGCRRDLLAEVAAERDRLEARIASVERPQHRHRAVRGAVVDEDRLPLEAQAVEHRAQTLHQGRDRACLVEAGHDHRQPRATRRPWLLPGRRLGRGGHTGRHARHVKDLQCQETVAALPR